MGFHKHAKYRKYRDYYGIPPGADNSADEAPESKFLQKVAKVAVIIILLFSIAGNGYQYVEQERLGSSILVAEERLVLSEAKVYSLDDQVGLLQVRVSHLLASDSILRTTNSELSKEHNELLADYKKLVEDNSRMANALNVAELENATLTAANHQLRFVNNNNVHPQHYPLLRSGPRRLFSPAAVPPSVHFNEPPGGTPHGKPILAGQISPKGKEHDAAYSNTHYRPAAPHPWWARFSLPQVFFLSCTMACIPVFFHAMWKMRRHQRNQFRPGRHKPLRN